MSSGEKLIAVVREYPELADAFDEFRLQKEETAKRMQWIEEQTRKLMKELAEYHNAQWDKIHDILDRLGIMDKGKAEGFNLRYDGTNGLLFSIGKRSDKEKADQVLSKISESLLRGLIGKDGD